MKNLLLPFALLVSGSAKADDTKFALVCEWHAGGAGGSTTFHVDMAANTVDGRRAVITPFAIHFMKGAVEHSIDRTSGVLTRNDLKPGPGIQLAGPITRCTKTSAKRF